MGVMVLPVQAHRGSDDSNRESRNESSRDGNTSRTNGSDVSDRGDRDNNNHNRNDNDRNDRFSRRLIGLSGENEVPVTDTDGRGWAKVKVSVDDGTVCYSVKVKNIAAVTAAHIHTGAAGVNGGVVVDLAILTADSKVRGNSTFYWNCVEVADTALLTAIKENRAGYYLNVHTTEFPDGAIRGQLGKVHTS
jgi:hypothetical protein